LSDQGITELLVAIAVGGSLGAALLAMLADHYIKYARWLVFVPLGISGVSSTMAGVGVLFGLPVT